MCTLRKICDWQKLWSRQKICSFPKNMRLTKNMRSAKCALVLFVYVCPHPAKITSLQKICGVQKLGGPQHVCGRKKLQSLQKICYSENVCNLHKKFGSRQYLKTNALLLHEYNMLPVNRPERTRKLRIQVIHCTSLVAT